MAQSQYGIFRGYGYINEGRGGGPESQYWVNPEVGHSVNLTLIFSQYWISGPPTVSYWAPFKFIVRILIYFHEKNYWGHREECLVK